MAVGVVAPGRADEVRQLEAAGAASFWVGGHIASPNPSPEAIAWLGRVVEQTTSAVVGTATLVLPWYPPALVAKQLADLDRASGGRLAVGVGVGGEYPDDFAAVDVPVAERGTRTDEAIALLRQFWTGEPVHHDGPHFRFDGIRVHPAPAQPGGPPILVTGRRGAAMRRAALLGDGWMPYLYSADAYARSVARIEQVAAVAGRDLDRDGFTWLVYVMVAIDDDGAAARRQAAAFLGATYRQDFEPLLDRVAVAGDGDHVGERLQALVDAGARHLILLPCNDDRLAAAERLLGEIAPLLRMGPPHAGAQGDCS